MSKEFDRAAFDAASRTLLWREALIEREVAGTLRHWLHLLYPDTRNTAAYDPGLQVLAARIVLALSELYTTGEVTPARRAERMPEPLAKSRWGPSRRTASPYVLHLRCVACQQGYCGAPPVLLIRCPACDGALLTPCCVWNTAQTAAPPCVLATWTAAAPRAHEEGAP